MMSSIGNNIHPTLAVPGFPQFLDGVIAACRVHPVVVAVHKGDGDLECVNAVNQGQAGMCTRS